VGHGGPGNKGISKYSFDCFNDPERNGGGAMIDFQCYTALWSLWYLGTPEKVYAQVNHLRPESFPKVEDNSTMILSYPKGVGLFEGSWDLPRGFQDLEVFGLDGSLSLTKDKVQWQKGRQGKAQDVPAKPLSPEHAGPIAHMVYVLKSGKPLDRLVGLEMNVGVVEILEAAQMSVKSGQAIRLPLPKPAAD
jgi:predicted dehydrogenase